MDRYLGCKFILGGDFNVTRPSNAVIYHTIDKFCVASRLEWLDSAPVGVNYTYHNDALLTHSLIDHFICSPELVQSQQYVHVMDDGNNLSDHYAIHYEFKLPCGHADSHHSHSPELARKLLWDRADLTAYQSFLSTFLADVTLPVDALLCANSYCSLHRESLESYYQDIVSCLSAAGSHCVPSSKPDIQKHWWTPEITTLKEQCIDIRYIWKSVGRPRSRPINAKRLKCKFRYKQAIKDAAFEDDKKLNDDLFNHLCKKDDVGFWKAWRKRFCSSHVKPTNVLNGKHGNGDDISPEFTQFFSNNFKPNSVNADSKFKSEVDKRLCALSCYTVRYTPCRINVTTLLTHIGKLKRRKSAGFDGITNEHILVGGLNLAVHSCLLFNALLSHAFVPDNFCRGIVVPLLKNKHGDSTSLDMYRGITLLTVISKIFESVLLELFDDFFEN